MITRPIEYFALYPLSLFFLNPLFHKLVLIPSSYIAELNLKGPFELIDLSHSIQLRFKKNRKMDNVQEIIK
jgi:hypothetical protein